MAASVQESSASNKPTPLTPRTKLRQEILDLKDRMDKVQEIFIRDSQDLGKMHERIKGGRNLSVRDMTRYRTSIDAAGQLKNSCELRSILLVETIAEDLSMKGDPTKLVKEMPGTAEEKAAFASVLSRQIQLYPLFN
jgi:hypothetical protein